MSWQPIETAPKDGTYVLITGWLYNDSSKGRWQEVAAWRDDEWMQLDCHSGLFPPTHWMPLPEPPK